MKKYSRFLVAMLTLAFLMTPLAFAKKDGDPAGWTKGKKKGWHEGDQPPGLSHKEAEKAKKDAEKKAKKAQKEAEKKAKKAKAEAEKKAEEAKEKAQS